MNKLTFILIFLDFFEKNEEILKKTQRINQALLETTDICLKEIHKNNRFQRFLSINVPL